MLSQNEIKNAIHTIAPRYGIESVYLFGSYARGDASEDSDCDFRIVGGEIYSLLDLGGLYEDLMESLNCKVDIVLTKNIRPDFYEKIKDDEVLIYGRL